MSQAAKKFKLDAEGSMDPFDEEILPFDVHEHILQYLNGSDLLKASEVSRCWSQKVENAKGFIEKIKLTITAIPPPEGIATRSMTRNVKNKLTRQDIAAVLNSQRNYVNVDIRLNLIDTFNLRQELLQKFAASIKHMKFDDYIDDETPDVTFPNLTHLGTTDPDLGFRFRSFRILLPLMPAVETLSVGTMTNSQMRVISCKSKSLREVKCKRYFCCMLPSHPSFIIINHNIVLIQE